MLVLPFSTDQFAGAATLERAGVGVALDPNAASSADLRAALEGLLLGETAGAASALGSTMRDKPGRQRAFEAMTGGLRRG